MKKVFSLLFVVMIASFCTIINVKAATTWQGSVNSVTITRSVTDVTNPVTNTFSYTVTANANNPSGASGAPTSGSIAMSNQAVSGTTATKTGTISFSGMTFTQPGHYFYTISETASTNATRYPIDSTTYTVEIAVINTNASNPDGTNFTAQIYVYNTASTPAKANANFTSASPQSQYASVDLTKKVIGQAANVNDYFYFAVQIYTAGTYTISGLTSGASCKNGNTTYTNASTTASITGKASSPVATAICLKKGETAHIGLSNSLNQLPLNTKVTITEAVASGYDDDSSYPKYKFNNGTATAGKTMSQKTISTAGVNTVEFTNNKNDSEWGKTGVLITTLPYIILIAVGAIGAFVFMNSKKQKLATDETDIL